MKLELEVKTKEEAERLIKQLQEFVEEKKETLYPNIESCDMFYIIDREENIVGMNYNHWIDTFERKDLANYYESREIAQKSLQFKKSRKVWNFIENWAMHNSTFEPDWNSEGQVKYYVVYYSKASRWDTSYSYTVNANVVYVSKEEADRLVKILNSSDEYRL